MPSSSKRHRWSSGDGSQTHVPKVRIPATYIGRTFFHIFVVKSGIQSSDRRSRRQAC